MESIFNKKNKRNEILITTLENQSWPLIRYNTGDQGAIYYEYNNAYISLLDGRSSILFDIKDKRYNTILFSGLARNICSKYGNNVIQQFQVVKKSDDEICIDLKLLDICSKEEIISEYKEEILKIINSNIKISVKEKEIIAPDKNTGKVKEFVDLSQ